MCTGAHTTSALTELPKAVPSYNHTPIDYATEAEEKGLIRSTPHEFSDGPKLYTRKNPVEINHKTVDVSPRGEFEKGSKITTKKMFVAF
jgi:hypothetical protein